MTKSMRRKSKKKVLSALLAMAVMTVCIGGCGSTPVVGGNVVESTESNIEIVESNEETTTETEIKDEVVAGADKPAEPTTSPTAEPSPEPTPTAKPTPEPTPEPTVPPHVHEYAETVTKQPSCAEAGVKTLTCSCGDVKTEAIPATGNHNWVEEMETVVIPSTGHVETTEQQVQVGTTRRTEYECSYCGARFDTPSGVVDHCYATGDINHAFASTIAWDYDEPVYETQTVSEWIIDSPETTSVVGTGRFTCSTCKATK